MCALTSLAHTSELQLVPFILFGGCRTPSFTFQLHASSDAAFVGKQKQIIKRTKCKLLFLFVCFHPGQRLQWARRGPDKSKRRNRICMCEHKNMACKRQLQGKKVYASELFVCALRTDAWAFEFLRVLFDSRPRWGLAITPFSICCHTAHIVIPQFKGTLSGFKDLFKALILIGRGLFCHIKRGERGGRGNNATGLAEILKGGRLAEDLQCGEDWNLKYRTQNACCNRYEIGLLNSMKGWHFQKVCHEKALLFPFIYLRLYWHHVHSGNTQVSL